MFLTALPLSPYVCGHISSAVTGTCECSALTTCQAQGGKFSCRRMTVPSAINHFVFTACSMSFRHAWVPCRGVWLVLRGGMWLCVSVLEGCCAVPRGAACRQGRSVCPLAKWACAQNRTKISSYLILKGFSGCVARKQQPAVDSCSSVCLPCESFADCSMRHGLRSKEGLHPVLCESSDLVSGTPGTTAAAPEDKNSKTRQKKKHGQDPTAAAGAAAAAGLAAAAAGLLLVRRLMQVQCLLAAVFVL